MVGRIILGITGGIAVLIGGGIAAAGAFGVGIAGERVESSAVALGTPTRAVISPTAAIDIDTDLPAVVANDRLALRLRATPRGGEPLFIGIAPTAQIERWLGDAARDEIVDVDGDRVVLSRVGTGDGPPRDPRSAGIWAAQATSAGAISIDWSLLDAPNGRYSAVVMNADGSPGVQADAAVGGRVPDWVSAIGWCAIVLGGIGVLTGLVAIGAALRRPPTQPAAGPSPVPPSPVAAPPVS